MNKDATTESRRGKERFYYKTDNVIEKPFNWKQLSRLFGYMKPYLKTLIPYAILSMIVGTAVRLIVPIIIGVYAFDKAIKNKDYTLLSILVAITALLYLANYISNVYRIRLTNKLGQYVIHDLRKHLFNHVQRLSHRFFDSRSAGSILVRIINDVNSLQDLFTNGVINTLMDLVMLIGIFVILFSLSPQLALAVLIVMPLMFLISTKLRRSIRRSWQKVRLKMSKLNSHLNESIQGVRVTQSFTQEKENMSFFNGVNTENYDAWREATQKNAVFRPFVDMSNAIGSVILIWYGSHLINVGTIEIGVFVSFAFYLGMFWAPISRLGQVYNQLLVAMASSERIFEFLDEKPNVKEKPDAKSMDNINGTIELSDVEFSYDETRKALKGINLHIEAGEAFALVGHTGSGKTTIANLIGRFYDPTKGKVSFDGIDIMDIKLDELRAGVSTVLQDTFVFSGTIMENIRFGRPDATDDEVIKAAEAVGANHFIERLADGFLTEVEERGNVLSVGERQLLSFARALLANPKILILDEATASIDTETELIIQEAMKKLLKGRTSIIIAHRLSTIRDADKIVVMEEGNILEQGNHDELMKKHGKYFELVVSQFNNAEIA
ncbi:putative ABC transport system ATP-binding protein/ATP-binding cassette subfamily B protein [Scopulibacillus darangshiensis]|uniref:Putative ABC transport system ATP-binding protein/ATP-binding cassette subfamily B protein n=1 Tax=Scopulibacillus darangshiensis TaxID=442528 RepID=A0A4R2P9J2_9BACL|nr:ABC transporter ATP-binding protein [Scopulibacillus darangshiensis]TCP30535.1 putative ABC transport system ATP-binding protein/ATP-binding cassette subfamily B protein [Scopulibacillus darangshiensis]